MWSSPMTSIGSRMTQVLQWTQLLKLTWMRGPDGSDTSSYTFAGQKLVQGATPYVGMHLSTHFEGSTILICDGWSSRWIVPDLNTSVSLSTMVDGSKPVGSGIARCAVEAG